MTYTLEWLKTFDGEIDILNVKMDCLANTIEKNGLFVNCSGLKKS